ncbi:MAG TPA: response regulator transcription factor [Armatimonadota bacterium]|nr:response regulator transcription factor [Armatimonadota bacterium]
MAITIVVADDHQLVRQGLKATLAAEPQFSFVGEAGNGLDAVSVTERLRPDVLVLDLMMPGLGGSDVARQVSHRSPSTHILMLSMHDDEIYVRQAMNAGAIGYALKDCSGDELVQAVREVAAGRPFLSSSLVARAKQQFIQRTTVGGADPYETLTNREREVLHLITEGCTSPQIANRLFISRRTAESHRANLMRKLNLNSQAELLRYALRRGITML